MKKYIAPLLVISLGLAWLLNVKGLLPSVNWIWTLGLAITGLILLFIEKINNFNFVIGLFMVISSIFSILRQTGKISIDTEMPILFIILGILMLLSLLLKLSKPDWITKE